MTHISNEFTQMRFRKTVVNEGRSFSMSADMYRLFFALRDDKPLSEILSQQPMAPAAVLDCISRLWTQGLIEPVGLTNLYLDINFSKLLKINLYYIIGRKDLAVACVDSALRDLGLSPEHFPASQADALVAAVSAKITDPRIRQKFADFMKALTPLRAKMKISSQPMLSQNFPAPAGLSRGKTRQIIDRIISTRSGGNPIIAKNIKTKLILKGINPDAYFPETVDNPKTLESLRLLAQSMGINLAQNDFSGGNGKGSSGQIQRLILDIINSRSRGNPLIAKDIRTKLFLKGINIDGYGPDTPDDPVVLKKVKDLATTLGVAV
jgi:hypothetical protein